ncbi:MAG: hypothetical protein ACLP4V_12980 [Methylocella sp.]|jgi:hypothetical protein
MKASTKCFLSVPMLVAGSIALSGCGRSASTPTTITYHQVGVCKTYETPSGAQQAKNNEGFAIFKIESVDNTKYNNLFKFDPGRFYVDQTTVDGKSKGIYGWDRRFVNKDPRFGKAMGVKYVAEAEIQAGQKLEDAGFALIPLATNNPTGIPEADQYNFQLVYDTGSDDRGNMVSASEGIIFVRTNPADTKWSVVEDCKELPLT